MANVKLFWTLILGLVIVLLFYFDNYFMNKTPVTQMDELTQKTKIIAMDGALNYASSNSYGVYVYSLNSHHQDTKITFVIKEKTGIISVTAPIHHTYRNDSNTIVAQLTFNVSDMFLARVKENNITADDFSSRVVVDDGITYEKIIFLDMEFLYILPGRMLLKL